MPLGITTLSRVPTSYKGSKPSLKCELFLRAPRHNEWRKVNAFVAEHVARAKHA